MSAKEEETFDVVLFLDANMPRFDRCSENCADKSLVLCAHKFDFKALVIHPGKALEGLNDFRVLQHIFKIIRRGRAWTRGKKKPLFYLLTKDHDFLNRDAPNAYNCAVRRGENEVTLEFKKGSVSDGENEIFVKVVGCKSYGTNRQDNLRCAVQIMNKVWSKVEDS